MSADDPNTECRLRRDTHERYYWVELSIDGEELERSRAYRDRGKPLEKARAAGHEHITDDTDQAIE